MRVGVIGAGLSGLAAARTLVDAGHDVVVIDKGRGVGGRIASRRIDETVVDHGLPCIPIGESDGIERLVRALPADDLVELDGAGVAYRSGMTRLPKLMADGLPLVLGVRIAALRAAGRRLELAGEQGNTHGVVDAVVLSAPAPQAADLLAASPDGAARARVLRTAEYAPAVMILAGLALPAPERLDPFPLGEPFARITAETAKGRPTRDGIVPVVARLDVGPSARFLDASDATILDAVLPQLTEVCGASADPAWVQVKRWRYATVRRAVDQAAVNPPGHPVVVCGDAVAAGGLGRVYASGIAAAHAVMALPSAAG